MLTSLILWVLVFAGPLSAARLLADAAASDQAGKTVISEHNRDQNAGENLAAAPYMAKQTTRHKQVLGDGTIIDQLLQTTTFYRDSKGRTRFQRTLIHEGETVSQESAVIEIKIPLPAPM